MKQKSDKSLKEGVPYFSSLCLIWYDIFSTALNFYSLKKWYLVNVYTVYLLLKQNKLNKKLELKTESSFHVRLSVVNFIFPSIQPGFFVGINWKHDKFSLIKLLKRLTIFEFQFDEILKFVVVLLPENCIKSIFSLYL